MAFLKPGNLSIGFVSSLEGFNEERCFIRDPKSWSQKIQRAYGTHEFGPSRNMVNSFVLLQLGSEEKAKLSVLQILLFSGWKWEKTKSKRNLHLSSAWIVVHYITARIKHWDV